jgi:hypothetical protein
MQPDKLREQELTEATAVTEEQVKQMEYLLQFRVVVEEEPATEDLIKDMQEVTGPTANVRFIIRKGFRDLFIVK